MNDARREKQLVASKKWKDKNKKRTSAYALKWQAANPDRVKKIAKAYYERNKEKLAAYRKAWREKNRESNLAQKRLHYQQNRQRIRSEQAKKYATKRSNGQIFGGGVVPEPVALLYKNGCGFCGSHERLHLDHKLPRSRGGKTVAENLQWLCRRCNQSKTDMTTEEFFEHIGNIYRRRIGS